ncbi:hypothetical protein [Corynebacterium fournieri]
MSCGCGGRKRSESHPKPLAQVSWIRVKR